MNSLPVWEVSTYGKTTPLTLNETHRHYYVRAKNATEACERVQTLLPPGIKVGKASSLHHKEEPIFADLIDQNAWLSWMEANQRWIDQYQQERKDRGPRKHRGRGSKPQPDEYDPRSY